MTKTTKIKRMLYRLWCRLHRYRVIYISDHPFLAEATFIICWGDPGWHKFYKKFSRKPYMEGYSGLSHPVKRFISDKDIEKVMMNRTTYYGNPYDYPEKRKKWT